MPIKEWPGRKEQKIMVFLKEGTLSEKELETFHESLQGCVVYEHKGETRGLQVIFITFSHEQSRPTMNRLKEVFKNTNLVEDVTHTKREENAVFYFGIVQKKINRGSYGKRKKQFTGI